MTIHWHGGEWVELWGYVGAGLAGTVVPEQYANCRDIKIAAAMEGVAVGVLCLTRYH